MTDLSSLTVPELVRSLSLSPEAERYVVELARRADSAEALAEALERLRNAPVTVAPGRDYPLEQWRADVEFAEQALARYRGEKK